MIKNLGIRPSLILTLAIVLTVGMIVVMGWNSYSTFSNLRHNVEDQVNSLSGSISQALYAIMASGDSDSLKDYLINIRRLKTVKDIRIVRSNTDFPSGPSVASSPATDLEGKVITSGKEIVIDTTIGKERALCRIMPVVASKSCLSCHSQFKEGQVMAVISTSISYQSYYDQIVRDLWKTGLIQFLNLFTVLFFIYLLMGNLILKGLFKLVENLNQGIIQTTSVAGQVSSSAQTTSQRANEQASNLEETSSAIDEITSMIKQNADNAAKASQMASEAKISAQKSEVSLKEMQISMAAIDESTQKVGKIIKTIEEIAFQTNILALNAAVEAARAGEHGKGFAVVADEVRNLAMRASLASKDTQALIENSQQQTKQGADVTQKASEALRQIMNAAKKVADVVNEIAIACKEQAEGINQVTGAISQMDQVTQQNAASAEESAAAAEELSNQADNLKEMVLGLQKIVNGDKTST